MLDAIWQYLLTQIHTNEFFTGAALGGVVLAALHYLRGAAATAARAVVRRLTVSATVHSEDPLYVPISQWLHRFRFDRLSRRYRIRMPLQDDDGPPRRVGARTARKFEDAVFGPDYGTYLFRYAGKWLRIQVLREGEGAGTSTSREAQTREFLTISYLGVSRRILDEIIAQALEIADEHRAQVLPCFQASIYNWEPAGGLPRAQPTSCPVVLEAGLLESIESDIAHFFDSRDWYEQRGLAWRRGYLLHGPPGTGKTSLCRYLARRFDMAIYVMDSAGYASERLGTMLKEIPPRSLVLFEDIDCHDVASSRSSQVTGNKSDDPFSALLRTNIGTLLNAIDGVNPPEQLLIMMTSNNPEKLDPALVRPGRVDRRIHLGHCSTDQAARLLTKFYPDASGHDVEVFRALVPPGVFTPAELQERFITAGTSEAVLASFRVEAQGPA